MLKGEHRTLVHGGPQLLDEKYYTGNDRESNLGIGKDGEFYGEELFLFCIDCIRQSFCIRCNPWT